MIGPPGSRDPLSRPSLAAGEQPVDSPHCTALCTNPCCESDPPTSSTNWYPPLRGVIMPHCVSCFTGSTLTSVDVPVSSCSSPVLAHMSRHSPHWQVFAVYWSLRDSLPPPDCPRPVRANPPVRLPHQWLHTTTTPCWPVAALLLSDWRARCVHHWLPGRLTLDTVETTLSLQIHVPPELDCRNKFWVILKFINLKEHALIVGKVDNPVGLYVHGHRSGSLASVLSLIINWVISYSTQQSLKLYEPWYSFLNYKINFSTYRS